MFVSFLIFNSELDNLFQATQSLDDFEDKDVHALNVKIYFIEVRETSIFNDVIGEYLRLLAAFFN